MITTSLSFSELFFNAILGMKYDEDGYPVDSDEWDEEELIEEDDDDLLDDDDFEDDETEWE